MKPAAFEYVRPAIARGGARRARATAATDAQAARRRPEPRARCSTCASFAPTLLVDLTGIAGLDGSRRANGDVRVGAPDPQRGARAHPRSPDRCRCAEALPYVGHVVTRNRGTVGGSIAHADAGGRAPARLAALGGTSSSRPAGGREIAAGDLFVAHFTTTLEPGELVVATHLAGRRTRLGYAFEELALRHGDYALAHGRLRARASTTAASSEARVGVGAVADRPLLVDVARSPAGARRRVGARPPREAARGRGSSSPRARPRLGRVPAAPHRRARRAPRRAWDAHGAAAHDRGHRHGQRPACRERVEPRLLLSDFLRHRLGLTGTHVGLRARRLRRLHGAPRRRRGALAASLLAVQADGCDVRDRRGASRGDGPLTPLQEAFRAHHALQCGFCTPGILMAAEELLERGTAVDRDEIVRPALGHLCRCTGYAPIVDAIEDGGAGSRVNLARACSPPPSGIPEREAFSGARAYGELLPRASRRIAGGLGARAAATASRSCSTTGSRRRSSTGPPVGGRGLRAALWRLARGRSSTTASTTAERARS